MTTAETTRPRHAIAAAKFGVSEEARPDGSEDSALEIIAVGIDPSRLPKFSTQLSSLQSSTSTPNGVHLILSDETEVDKALTLIRECEGKLVSINPRRVSLEDIFDKADVAEEL